MAPGIKSEDGAVCDASAAALPTVVNGGTVNGGVPLLRISEANPTQTAQETSQLFSLAHTTTVITGAGRGLGITLAGAVLEAGGHVACLDILSEPSALEWAVLQKKATVSRLVTAYYQCDITDEEAMSRIFDRISQEAQARNAPIRGTVACAGIQQQIPAIEYPKHDFERILQVNVTGAFLTAQHAAKKMIETSVAGSIVMVASMSGHIANRGLSCTAYNSSKAAVQQMTRSLAQEWGQHGIRVNSLSPGYIRTAMTEALLEAEPQVKQTWMAGAMLGRLGVPDDFKAPVVFLLGPGSSFMTGADLRVDGGHCASA